MATNKCTAKRSWNDKRALASEHLRAEVCDHKQMHGYAPINVQKAHNLRARVRAFGTFRSNPWAACVVEAPCPHTTPPPKDSDIPATCESCQFGDRRAAHEGSRCKRDRVTCAMTDESAVSIAEWMMDWGCTTICVASKSTTEAARSWRQGAQHTHVGGRRHDRGRIRERASDGANE
eukprot:6178190-Pleurochrysis_carterae.AAC.1